MAHEQRLLYLSAVVGLVVAWAPHGTSASGTRAPGGIAQRNTAPRPPAPPEWVRFEDPVEHAFTLDVPKGWTARGGLVRLGYSDHRAMIDVTSPDGRINVRVRQCGRPHLFHAGQSPPGGRHLRSGRASARHDRAVQERAGVRRRVRAGAVQVRMPHALAAPGCRALTRAALPAGSRRPCARAIVRGTDDLRLPG